MNQGVSESGSELARELTSRRCAHVGVPEDTLRAKEAIHTFGLGSSAQERRDASRHSLIINDTTSPITPTSPPCQEKGILLITVDVVAVQLAVREQQ